MAHASRDLDEVVAVGHLGDHERGEHLHERELAEDDEPDEVDHRDDGVGGLPLLDAVAHV